MAMTQSEIETAIAALEAVKLKRLTGAGAVTSLRYGEKASEFQPASLADIEHELVRLRMALSRLTGEPSGVGPVRPRFGAMI